MSHIKFLFSRALRIPYRIRIWWYTYWNRFVFWLNGVKFGNNMRIHNCIYLRMHYRAKLIIGDEFTFSSGAAINPLCRNIKGCIYLPEESSVLEIGNQSGISSACIWAKERITIGNRVLIGGDCILLDTDAHNLDYHIRASKDLIGKMSIDCFTAKSKPIVIEDDVLIGTRCIILKGVTIGARTIIGSGSVVTKSIPADCIAAGNPCQVIKSNNDENLIH
jgi:acetyltransferase-like isoleucine patch superfamily enzyme